MNIISSKSSARWFRVSIAAALAAAPLVVSVGCTGDTEKPRSKRGASQPLANLPLDGRSESELGQAVAIRLTNQYPVSKDARLNKYVNLVGATVAAASEAPDRDYAFAVLETNDVGSFAAPGGYIFVTRGAINLMSDEAQLAGVLAQEVAHTLPNLRHAQKAIGSTGLMSNLDSVARRSDRSEAFNSIADAMYDLIAVKGYGSSREDEAVGYAASMLYAANYSVQSYAAYLKKLQQMQSGVKLIVGADTLASTANRAASEASSAAKAGQTLAERFRMYVPVVR